MLPGVPWNFIIIIQCKKSLLWTSAHLIPISLGPSIGCLPVMWGWSGETVYADVHCKG